MQCICCCCYAPGAPRRHHVEMASAWLGRSIYGRYDADGSQARVSRSCSHPVAQRMRRHTLAPPASSCVQALPSTPHHTAAATSAAAAVLVPAAYRTSGQVAAGGRDGALYDSASSHGVPPPGCSPGGAGAAPASRLAPAGSRPAVCWLRCPDPWLAAQAGCQQASTRGPASPLSAKLGALLQELLACPRAGRQSLEPVSRASLSHVSPCVG